MSDLKTAPFDHAKQARMLEFLKTVSPEADAGAILLFAQLAHAQRLIMNIVDKHLSQDGLSWHKFRILFHLLRSETLGNPNGLQPSELSDLESIPRNSMSDLLVMLEQDGLVRREIHRTDRRKFVIRLSPKGRRLVRAKLDSELGFISECFATLSSRDRKQLGELLQQVESSLAQKNQIG